MLAITWCLLQRVVVEQTVGLHAFVGLFDAGVGVVEGLDTEFAAVGQGDAQTNAVFKAEGGAQFLAANPGFVEAGYANAAFNKGLQAWAGKGVGDNRSQ